MKNSGISDVCFGSQPHPPTRRDFAYFLATLFSGFGIAGSADAFPRRALPLALPSPEEISHSAEAIHQDVTFNATPARVYDALTDAKQFNRVVQLSAAAQSMAVPNTTVAISREPGGAFSAFGGHITGRQIELIPNQRIVQAWRAASWPVGAYSIARFDLSADGTATKLSFDHTGFPQGLADHLLAGWKGNYWEPLAKFLAQPS